MTNEKTPRPTGVLAIVTEVQAAAFAAAGFDLFASRGALRDAPTAYLCTDFVCELPMTVAADLSARLTE